MDANIINITDIELAENFEILVSRVSTLTTIFQAIGGLILIYIVFNILNAIINKKKEE